MKAADTKPTRPAPVSRVPNVSRVAGQASGNSPRELNRALGNRAAQQSFGSGITRTELRVGEPGDVYEREADRVADSVMRMPLTGSINGITPSERAVQRRCGAYDREEILQRKAQAPHSANTAPASPDNAVNLGGGSPLNPATRLFFEPRFGADFGAVRVHTGAEANALSNRFAARAFTYGNDIVFGNGEYRPESPGGRHLLAHELTHVMQQSGHGTNKRIQRASLVSDGERFVVSGSEGSYFDFGDLISAVMRRYELDSASAYQVARWLDRRHGIFRYGDRRYDEPVIPMPRLVAFFLVDWVEPFTAYGGTYGISPEAFDKAQQIWAQQNVFVGFRRGGPVGGASFEQIDFAPGARADGALNRNSIEELNLLALRSRSGLPPGYYHIVVTGNTTEDATAAGKSIRSSDEEPVDATSEGILLFAGTYVRLGYRQVVPRGDSGQELGELLAHEIGHFLFGLTHNRPPEATDEGIMIHPKTDIMRGGEQMDPNDSIGSDSRVEIDEAFQTGRIPRPATPTSRR